MDDIGIGVQTVEEFFYLCDNFSPAFVILDLNCLPRSARSEQLKQLSWGKLLHQLEYNPKQERP